MSEREINMAVSCVVASPLDQKTKTRVIACIRELEDLKEISRELVEALEASLGFAEIEVPWLYEALDKAKEAMDSD